MLRVVARLSAVLTVTLTCWLTSSGVAVAQDGPLLPDCGNVAYGGSAMPTSWSSGCLGGSLNLDGLTWLLWATDPAIAHGVVRYNTCDPDCASGDVYDYPAELTVDRLKRCASPLGLRRYYTRFSTVITWPEGNAAGKPPGRDAPFTFSARCPTAGGLVATRGRAARFGAFTERWDSDGGRLDQYFGPPSSTDADRYACAKRWRGLGLRVTLGVFGGDANPCSDGVFLQAVLTGRRWHTRTGISPGSPARRAARFRTRKCTPRLCRGMKGYVLGLHWVECAAARYPNVIAQTEGGRVKRLIVYSHGCE